MEPGYTPSPGYGELLPHPSPITASDFDAWFFLFWAGLLVVVIALPWALTRLIRHKDTLPILCLGAGLITSLGEPMLDLVGHLRWSENLHGPAFTNFGIPVPLLIPPCYALFMGLEAYWLYSVIQRGITVRGFFLMFAAIGLSDAIMEHPGVIMGVYEYYGTQPFEFYKFPFYWSFTNGVAICTIGVLLHYVWPHVKDRGTWQLLVLPLGIIGTTMGEFGSGFPVFLAINADIPTWLQWVIGSLTLVISVVWIRVLAHLVAKDDANVEWTFWGLFKSRFMLPHQREAYIQGITRQPGAVAATGRDA
ncbi:MAG TPA: hypothetical protein VD931_00120 [Baekduia sp.]|nr:hypothetical protein [Baekduia sp.]